MMCLYRKLAKPSFPGFHRWNSPRGLREQRIEKSWEKRMRKTASVGTKERRVYIKTQLLSQTRQKGVGEKEKQD